ncbi:MAG: ABC transporter permease [Austwickia sp.]|nr:ABC transporter permease [Actinomycetota bacterium]MCB1252013.1 ABC transporter permease [Austwickia sp.]MCO5308538.1 ABC transporter permease [Austwickia sp.]
MSTPTVIETADRTAAEGSPSRPTGGPVGLLAAQVGAELRQMVRVPEYLVGIVGVPVILYAMFGLSNAGQRLPGGTDVGAMLVASFSAYAVVSLAIFTFGVDVAAERGRGWLRRLRCTPMPMWAYFAAKIAAALLLTVLIYVLVWALAIGAAGVPFEVGPAVRTLGALLVGTVAFAPMGFGLAFLARPKAAAAIGNLLFLPLSFVSGFFTSLSSLPQILRDVAPYLPTYHFGLLVWGGVAPAGDVQRFNGIDPGPAAPQLVWLAATFLLFGALAAWGYARDARRERE